MSEPQQPSEQLDVQEVADENLTEVAGGGNKRSMNVYGGGSFYSGANVNDF